MEYRTLGQTDMHVSALSYGASSLGGVFGEIDQREGVRAVHTAIDHGINLIDVSPFYGLTRAETVLGQALKEIDRDRYYLSTKCGRYGHDFADFDFSAARIERSIDESLERLNVDYVDLLHAHDIEFGDLDQVVNETLPAMQRIQKAGKARYLSISGLPLKVFTEVIDRAPAGTLNAILSYCHCALNDTSLLDILPRMQSAGLGVINASPTGMGLLSPNGPPDWHPAPRAVKDKCREAADYCQRRGESIARLAVQYAVRQPGPATTLVGTALPDYVAQNVTCLDEPMDEQLVNDVLAILEPIRNVSWQSGHAVNN